MKRSQERLENRDTTDVINIIHTKKIDNVMGYKKWVKERPDNYNEFLNKKLITLLFSYIYDP